MIEGLFDHRVRVLRPTEDASGSPVGFADETYSEATAAPTHPNAAIVPAKLKRTFLPAGERKDGETEVFFAAGTDVRRNDVLDVLAGPEAPSKWRVIDPRTPRGHHVEATIEPFAGNLVEV